MDNCPHCNTLFKEGKDGRKNITAERLHITKCKDATDEEREYWKEKRQWPHRRPNMVCITCNTAIKSSFRKHTKACITASNEERQHWKETGQWPAKWRKPNLILCKSCDTLRARENFTLHIGFKDVCYFCERKEKKKLSNHKRDLDTWNEIQKAADDINAARSEI